MRPLFRPRAKNGLDFFNYCSVKKGDSFHCSHCLFLRIADAVRIRLFFIGEISSIVLTTEAYVNRSDILHFIAMIRPHLHIRYYSIPQLKQLLTTRSGIDCRTIHSKLTKMTSTIIMTEASNGRSIAHSRLPDRWSPTRDHYSPPNGFSPNKRQRREDDSDDIRRRVASPHVLQNRTIARLKSTAGSAVSRGSSGSPQPRTYNPNDPNEKSSRSRGNFEILEIRSHPLPRMKDISASATVCRQFPKEEFVLGTIIKAPIHEEDFNWTARPQSVEASDASRERGRYSQTGVSTQTNTHSKGRHITFSNWNDPIYTEIRFMIVVALFHDHYLAIPLYTHGGNGLARKQNKWEYASIQDYREPRSLQEGGFLLHTEFLKPDCKHLLPKSVAHITYPVSRKYILPVAPQGHLRQDSIDDLVKAFTQYMLGIRPE